jgi:Cd2+/Zn2+-exporting ATPase
VNRQAIVQAIEKLGHSAETEENTKSAVLRIEEMDCADESEIVEKKLKSLPGIRNFDIYLVTREVKITYDPSRTSVQDIVKAVAETGMKASMAGIRDEERKPWWRSSRQTQLLVASGILIVCAFILEQVGFLHDGVKPFFGLAILLGAYYPGKMGLLALRTYTLNIRLLMVVGAVGAVLLGLWEEAALLVLIYSLGDVLEAYAVDKARGAIRLLMSLVPKEALVRRNGSEIVLPTEELVIGDVVIARPGEKIPMDGIVVAGSSYVDQSTITGESIPVERKTGHEVYAGTINQRGMLEIEVTKRSGDTTLARIIHSVEEAQAKKSSYQRFGEQFGKYYTPAMFVLALGVSLLPPLFFGADWPSFIYRGLVVLVVSCSCGLALSVPVSVVAAIANAARHGVLFKGGSYLEVAGELKAIAFDKTGTLTIGRPAVTDIVPALPYTEKDILSAAALIESRSEHPLAEAIVRRAREMDVQFSQAVESFESLTGLGVTARIDGSLYFLGNSRLFEERGISISQHLEMVSRLENDGKSVVLLGKNGSMMGVLAIADGLRPDAKESMKALRKSGLQVIMLTGDNEGTAGAIATQAGIAEYRSRLLPEGKVEAVKGLKERFGRIAMVGDGINDTPAMAVSDVGIAMGAAGTDIAMETGDIVLMSDDLSKIDYALRLSRRAVRNIRQNIAASLAIVVFLVPAGLMGWIGLVPGLLLNEVSALVVIANALRLLK